MLGLLALHGSLAAAVGVLAAGATPAATTDDADVHRLRPRLQQSLEIQALGITQLLPHAYFGGDAAYVVGNETFQVRFGAQAASGRGFEIGPGKVRNVLAVASLDGCGAKQVYRHRVRMCVGAQAGGMMHRWQGFEQPGRRATPYVAGVLRGDYRFSFTPRFGLMLGVGVSVPVVGPEFHARSANGSQAPLVFPGPVTGMLTVGASFRIR